MLAKKEKTVMAVIRNTNAEKLVKYSAETIRNPLLVWYHNFQVNKMKSVEDHYPSERTNLDSYQDNKKR